MRPWMFQKTYHKAFNLYTKIHLWAVSFERERRFLFSFSEQKNLIF